MLNQRFSRRKALAGLGALPVLGAAGIAKLAGLPSLEGAGPAAAAEGSGHAKGGHLTSGSRHAGFAQGRQTVDPKVNGFDPSEIVRDFDVGRTSRLADGRILREWDLTAVDKEIEVAPGVKFSAWTYNGRVPGPTLRAREGELLRVHFTNQGSHPHTIHFHGIHTAVMDGVPGVGEEAGGGLIERGERFTYEFDASPFGFHHYHCHTSPLAQHIHKGLYGAFIIDTNFDFSNEVYAVNTVAFHYLYRPIKVKRGELVRIYLLNILEFDQINSFHVHGNFFHRYPAGTSLEPTAFVDTIMQAQGERDVLELRFPFTGRYMFHAHKSEFAELGWMGFFEVVD